MKQHDNYCKTPRNTKNQGDTPCETLNSNTCISSTQVVESKTALCGKSSTYSMGVVSHQQECNGVQRHKHFLHMGLLSHRSKPNNICTSMVHTFTVYFICKSSTNKTGSTSADTSTKGVVASFLEPQCACVL